VPNPNNQNPTRNNTDVDSDNNGTVRPILRAYNASTSGARTFPSMNYIFNTANNDPAGSNQPSLTYTGTLPNAPGAGSTNGYVCAPAETCVRGERLPSIGRTMVFRVIARDNNAAGGGVADAQSTVTINGATGPFRVTAQNTLLPVIWQGNTTQTVTWDVNGSNVDAANVKISLSTDGGLTFPTTILASTPNDGTENITVPNLPTTTARIKIEAVGNIFFDINNVNFTITAASAAPAFVSGRIVTADGRGISRVRVALAGQNGETRTAITNAFGYYRIDDIESGQTYVLTVSAKRFTFAQPSRLISVESDITDADFVSNE